MSKRTPLHDRHTGLGGSMVPFAGYEMPLQYSSIREEHTAVRERAGVFDLSHMGEVRFRGSSAGETVQRLVANDVGRLEDGAALYALMCNERGGIIDDVIVYRIAADDYLVVVNAGCRDKDVAWMESHLLPGTDFADESDATALIAVQGPRWLDIIDKVTGDFPADLPSFHARELSVAGRDALVSRTGYTGEDGVEIYVAADEAGGVWDALLDVGTAVDLKPAGLGARDTLRLEAGLRLYGQDMDESTDPFSCGLGWTVRLDAGDFFGKSVLEQLDRAAPPRRFVGLQLDGRAIARHGQHVLANDVVVGEVTSGTYSFTLQRGIATAYVPTDLAVDAQLEVSIRGTQTPAERTTLPFYRRRTAAHAAERRDHG